MKSTYDNKAMSSAPKDDKKQLRSYDFQGVVVKAASAKEAQEKLEKLKKSKCLKD